MSFHNLTTATLLVLVSSVAFGHGGGGDIALFNTDGKTDIGFAELDDDDINQESFNPDVNVFQAVLVPVNRVPGVMPYDVGSSEPGFDANESVSIAPGQFSSGLPSDAAVTWNTIDLQYWDGLGQVAFSPTVGVNAGYAAPASGVTDSLGGFHSHPTFGLVREDNGPIADGVYLATLTTTVAGLEESDPFYLVTLVDDYITGQPDAPSAEAAAEQLGEVVRDFLADNLVDPTLGGQDFTYYADAVRYAESLAVPEPGAMLLVLAALAGVAVRNR